MGSEPSREDGEKSEVSNEMLPPTAKALVQTRRVFIWFFDLFVPREKIRMKSLAGRVNWSSFGLPSGWD